MIVAAYSADTLPIASSSIAAAIIQMNQPNTAGRGMRCLVSAQSPTTPQASRPTHLHTERIETSAPRHQSQHCRER